MIRICLILCIFFSACETATTNRPVDSQNQETQFSASTQKPLSKQQQYPVILASDSQNKLDEISQNQFFATVKDTLKEYTTIDARSFQEQAPGRQRELFQKYNQAFICVYLSGDMGLNLKTFYMPQLQFRMIDTVTTAELPVINYKSNIEISPRRGSKEENSRHAMKITAEPAARDLDKVLHEVIQGFIHQTYTIKGLLSGNNRTEFQQMLDDLTANKTAKIKQAVKTGEAFHYQIVSRSQDLAGIAAIFKQQIRQKKLPISLTHTDKIMELR